MRCIAVALAASLAAPAATHAEETALSKACLFAAAASLPQVPGLVISGSATTPASAIPVGSGDPTIRAMTVTLQVQAAGQAAIYEGTCTVGAKTPPGIADLRIREGTPPVLPPEQPKKQ